MERLNLIEYNKIYSTNQLINKTKPKSGNQLVLIKIDHTVFKCRFVNNHFSIFTTEDTLENFIDKYLQFSLVLESKLKKLYKDAINIVKLDSDLRSDCKIMYSMLFSKDYLNYAKLNNLFYITLLK